MTGLHGMVRQLRTKQDNLTREIKGVVAALAAFTAAYEKPRRTRGRKSAAGRRRIAASRKPSSSRVRQNSGITKAATSNKRTRSSAARKKVGSPQRAHLKKATRNK